MLGPVADLDRHASERPKALALATPHHRLSFAELRAAVLSAERRMRHAGVHADALVALDLPRAVEWVADLALFRIGARTVSLRGVTQPGELPLDVLVTEPGRSVSSAALIVEADEGWLDELWFDGSAPPPRDEAPAAFIERSAIFRYLLTSGTTGIPRAAAYSVGAFDYRMRDGDQHWTDDRAELMLIGLSTTGGFHAAAACLAEGVPYLAVDRIDAEAISLAAAHRIRVLCGSPMHVANAVHVALGAGIALPDLEEVRLAGAGPSEKLLGLIADTLGVPVRGVYGSTEGGGVSQVWYGSGVDRFDVGVPLPGVVLEVVDGSGAAVPAGTEGTVRYRSPGLVSGYLVDGDVVPLPGGWFVPGDRGRLTADGSLVLAGRDSELFNVGGVKLDPMRIDELALAFAGVRDAAAFPLERRAGIPEVGLAVVCGPECELRELDRELRARLPLGHPTAFWRIDEIPRTRLGKAQRGRLATDYEREVLRER